MANVSLQHIKKVYPNSETKKKKKGEPEKKSNLQITEELTTRIARMTSLYGRSAQTWQM